MEGTEIVNRCGGTVRRLSSRRRQPNGMFTDQSAPVSGEIVGRWPVSANLLPLSGGVRSAAA